MSQPELGPDLLGWFDRNRRDLPWRTTPRDPYATWVSEVMLQQTTVAAVVPYFQRWMEALPSVQALAQASESQVLALWQGLGYYRRARLLHQGARQIVAKQFPMSRSEWLQVPGAGKYTAAAIASIALGEPVAVADGNVQRVYSRLAQDPAVGPALVRNAEEWSMENLALHRPGDWNEALMELGATVCTPRSPECPRCPLKPFCGAFASGRVKHYPSPKPAKEWIEVSHAAVIPVCGGRFGVRPVPPGRWWEGMWELPREESLADLQPFLNGAVPQLLGTLRHVVTRHKVTVSVYGLTLVSEGPGLTWMTEGELRAVPMPAPARKMLTFLDQPSLC